MTQTSLVPKANQQLYSLKHLTRHYEIQFRKTKQKKPSPQA